MCPPCQSCCENSVKGRDAGGQEQFWRAGAQFWTAGVYFSLPLTSQLVASSEGCAAHPPCPSWDAWSKLLTDADRAPGSVWASLSSPAWLLSISQVYESNSYPRAHGFRAREKVAE